MRLPDSGKPVTRTQAGLVLTYLLVALARQVARDLRTIIGWARR